MVFGVRRLVFGVCLVNDVGVRCSSFVAIVHCSLFVVRWSLVVGRWSLFVGRWSLLGCLLVVVGLFVGRWSLGVGRWSLGVVHYSLFIVRCWVGLLVAVESYQLVFRRGVLVAAW